MKRRRSKRRSGMPVDRDLVPRVDADVTIDRDGSLPPEVERSMVVDPGQLEQGSFASRCSLKLLHEVVSKLDERKRELVQRIGFGGILHFPMISQVNRKFSMCLMSCVDQPSRSLVIPDIGRINIQREDVARVFGIPCGGNKVVDTGGPSKLCKAKVLKDFLGMEFKESRSIKVLKDSILGRVECNASGHEDDVFCVAFVVFVVSTLLSPSSKYDYASIDYWNAIQDPSAISSYDWAEFVVCRLMDAVSKLKHDMSSGVKFPNLTGCCLFLQVLYLDNIDIGDLNLKHYSFPRIRHFANDRIRMMIKASFPFNRNSNGGARCLKLRHPSSSCYSWAYVQTCRAIYEGGNEQLALLELAVCMARLLDVSVEAAGPIYVAADAFREQVEHGCTPSGSQAIKYLSILGRILISFKRGFNYRFSLSDCNVDSGNCTSVLNDAISCAAASGVMILSNPVEIQDVNKYQICCEQPHRCVSIDGCNRMFTHVGRQHGNDNCIRCGSFHEEVGDVNNGSSSTVAVSDVVSMFDEFIANQLLDVVMARFYLLSRKMKVPECLDPIAFIVDNAAVDRHNGSAIASSSCVPPPPWLIGYSWYPDVSGCSRLLYRLDAIRRNSRCAVIHRSPKYIMVSSDCLHDQMLGVSEFELDLFDATLRCVRQQDDSLYKDTPLVRWRHYFESDFMSSLISGCYECSEDIIRKHVSPDVVPYDISCCRLLFFPVLLQFRWVCYAWCLAKNVIYVFDPSFSRNATELTVESHLRNGSLLKAGMRKVFGRRIGGRQHDWFSADIRITPWIEKSISCKNRSGLLCALFCRCFDSERLNTAAGLVEPDAIASQLLDEISQFDWKRWLHVCPNNMILLALKYVKTF